MKKILFLLLTAALVSCTSDLNEEKVDIEKENNAKIIFANQNSVNGSLLIKVDEQLSRGLVSATKTEDGLTRSGIDPFDRALSQIEGATIERLIPVDARNEEDMHAFGLDRWYVVRFAEDANIDKIASSFAGVANVEKVQYNAKIKKSYDSKNLHPKRKMAEEVTRATTNNHFNDPYLHYQWHYNNIGPITGCTRAVAGADINANPAWEIETGDKDLIVAIVDEGVDCAHPDLAANMWVNSAEKNGTSNRDDDNNGYKDDINGVNFVTNGKVSCGTEFAGDSGHGTHVAGTVAAVNGNSRGCCGVAGGSGSGDGVRIMSCQIFSGNGGGTSEVTAAAITYAANNGASIIQCSWGYDGGAITSDRAYKNESSAEKEAIDYFMNKTTNRYSALQGGLAIFAAGNEATAMAGYPGGYRDYIAVTAFGTKGTPTSFTNYDKGCNIAAPGGDADDNMTSINDEDSSYSNTEIYSTYPTSFEPYSSNNTGYDFMQGTSMACPHVSGVAALGLSYAKRLGKTYTVDEFKALLLTSVNEIDSACTGTSYFFDTNDEGETWFGSSFNLSKFVGKMGTGKIDAFRVLMNVKGTPCLSADVKTTAQTFDLTEYIGKSVLKSITISTESKNKLGITTTPTVANQTLTITCTHAGSATFTLTMVAGGSTPGSDSSMGGMTITKEFAIIARAKTATSDRWL